MPNCTAWNSSCAAVTRRLSSAGMGKPLKSLSKTQYDDACPGAPGTGASGAQ